MTGTDGSHPRSLLHIHGWPCPCCPYCPRRPTLPWALPLAPHSAPPEPALGAQPCWVRPGPSACARVFPRVPRDAGPEAGFGEGHADTAWPEPSSVQPGLSLACFVFALSQEYFAEGEEFASAFFTRNGPCKSLLE